MAFTTGVVEFISIKPLAKPDNYDNLFRASFKIGEDWFSYGSTKEEQIQYKDGKEWKPFHKGDTIEFMYDVNGDFRNVQKSTIGVTAKGAGVSQAAPSQQAANDAVAGFSYNKSAKPGDKPFVNAAEIGQCMNLAVQLGLVKGYEGFTDAAIRDSIQKYKATRLRFHDLYNEEAPVEKKAPAPKAKAAYMTAPAQPDDEDI